MNRLSLFASPGRLHRQASGDPRIANFQPFVKGAAFVAQGPHMSEENSSDNIKSEIVKILQDPPKLHDWGSGLTFGGLEGDIALTVSEYLLDEFGPGNFHSIETGAGLSTVVISMCRPLKHIVINPDSALKERIFDYIASKGLDSSAIHYDARFSEIALPEYLNSEKCDFGLIDGGHGWPTVFVDFCYVNALLKKGGVLVVDDIVQFPCAQLFLLLKHQPGWRLEKIVYSKTAFFRKETDERLLPDFGGQPYIMNNLLFT